MGRAGAGVGGEAAVGEHVREGALGQSGDREERVDAEGAGDDRAVDDVEAVVDGG